MHILLGMEARDLSSNPDSQPFVKSDKPRPFYKKPYAVYYDKYEHPICGIWREGDGEKKKIQRLHFDGRWYSKDRPKRKGETPEKLPLFRLPQLLHPSLKSDPIFFVEGEKCALAIVDIGHYSVTTTMGGASQADRSNFDPEALSERHIVIIPDNDESGFKYAADVARLCAEAGAATITLCEIPGLRKGEDVADWIEAKKGQTNVSIKQDLFTIIETQGKKLNALPELPKEGEYKIIDLDKYDLKKGKPWALLSKYLHEELNLYQFRNSAGSWELYSLPEPDNTDRRHKIDSIAAFSHACESVFTVVKTKKEEKEVVVVSPRSNLAVMARERVKLEAEKVLGVKVDPRFNADGTIFKPGYNRTGFKEGVFYDPDPIYESVTLPNHTATQEDAQKAAAFILDAVCDFPFADEASKANLLANILTVVARDLLGGECPMAAIEATHPNAGKSKLAWFTQAVTSVPSRHKSIRPNKEGMRELEKRFNSALIRGGFDCITIDNLATTLESEEIESYITEARGKKVAVRRLGTSEEAEAESGVLIQVTMNNGRLNSDMSTRAMPIILKGSAQMQGDRDFKHGNFESYVNKNRAKLMEAALTIVQAWINAGKPRESVKWTRFPDFCSQMNGMLHYAGVFGYAENVEEFRQRTDYIRDERKAVIEAVVQSDKTGVKLRAGALLDILEDVSERTGGSYVPSSVGAKNGKNCQRKAMGAFMTAAEGFEVDGYTILKFSRGSDSGSAYEIIRTHDVMPF